MFSLPPFTPKSRRFIRANISGKKQHWRLRKHFARLVALPVCGRPLSKRAIGEFIENLPADRGMRSPNSGDAHPTSGMRSPKPQPH